ncbi:antigenic cell wall galactomanno protein-like protein [Elsinoe ampelina]|uniref:Antigenic cell wall galactomanno protein-like protein n=1 Tax=Elsinoe ampelina TaxID=302913 RepID=A0A6A6FZ97_9PEZI|nr:antigenic cell wall galactomanno protein-like protein [Elsinoe ampelina]
MKFPTLPLLSLLTLIPALTSADGASILSATKSVTRSATTFNSTVASFTGDLPTILTILKQSTDLLISIKKGTLTAKSSANLTDAEALTLVGPTQDLVATVQSTLNTVVRKKPVFRRTLTQVVALVNLKAEKEASDAFGRAVVGRVPVGLQPFAEALIAPLGPAFDGAIGEFEEFF